MRTKDEIVARTYALATYPPDQSRSRGWAGELQNPSQQQAQQKQHRTPGTSPGVNTCLPHWRRGGDGELQPAAPHQKTAQRQQAAPEQLDSAAAAGGTTSICNICWSTHCPMRMTMACLFMPSMVGTRIARSSHCSSALLLRWRPAPAGCKAHADHMHDIVNQNSQPAQRQQEAKRRSSNSKRAAARASGDSMAEKPHRQPTASSGSKRPTR